MPKPKKIPFTIQLDEADYKRLEALAKKEARPRAQMARLLILRALKEEK